MIFCARQTGKPGRAAKIVGLDANNLAKLGARVFEAPPEFRQRNLSRVNAFLGLLEVTLARAAALEALLHVAQNLAMCRDVFLGECNEAGITNDVDIGF